jgi:hypothetical protein
MLSNQINSISQAKSTLVAVTLSALFCLSHGCASNKLYVVNHSFNHWSTGANIKCKPTMSFNVGDPLKDVSVIANNDGSWRTLTDHVSSIDFTCDLVF